VPGDARSEAGIVALSCVELIYVVGILVPFTATVESGAKPVPFNVTVAAVLIGPEFGEIDVRTGTGGFAIVTVSAFDRDGLDSGLFTVIVAVPAAVSRLAGTVAMSDSPLL
jgi:hypothetical protein